MKAKNVVENIIRVPMNTPMAMVKAAVNMPIITLMAVEKNASGNTITRVIMSPPLLDAPRRTCFALLEELKKKLCGHAQVALPQHNSLPGCKLRCRLGRKS
jgi:hypothetical protein